MGRRGDNSTRRMPEIWSRDWIIVVLFALMLVAIVGQLVYIQVIRGPEYAARAASAHTADITLSARRGTIYDRNGEVVASNVDATTIYVNPKEVTDPAALARVLEEVMGPTTGKTYADYYSTVTQADLSFAYIMRKADVALAAQLKERLEADDVKGIHYLEDTKRVYPNGSVGSQVVGTVDIDGKGIAGLEMQYDKLLKGEDGSLVVEKGLKDIPVTNGESERVNAIDGTDIVTSMDISLQRRCEEALLDAIELHEAQGGTVTVLDASSGEIYASCSYVRKSDDQIAEEREAATKKAEAIRAARAKAANAANANAAPGEEAQPAEAQPEEEVVEDEVTTYMLEIGKLGAINDVYEPGSTFKPFTVLAVLENNKSVNPGTSYTVPYALEVYDTVITDSHDHETEDMSLTRILADSSNTGTTLVSREVDRINLYDTYKAFGLGSKTGVDFPGDAAGKLEHPDDWDGVQSATVTFGQGLTITGLQLLRAFGALEQDGVLRVPHFLTDVPNDPEKARELTEGFAVASTVADPVVCRDVNDMMTYVVTEGTGAAAAVDGFRATGKTGTAEIASPEGGYEENAYVMSFCGWLYGSSSDLVCLITVDRPLWGKGGGDVCGPVFADIMSFAAERYQIDAQAK